MQRRKATDVSPGALVCTGKGKPKPPMAWALLPSHTLWIRTMALTVTSCSWEVSGYSSLSSPALPHCSPVRVPSQRPGTQAETLIYRGKKMSVLTGRVVGVEMSCADKPFRLYFILLRFLTNNLYEMQTWLIRLMQIV